MSKRVRTDVLDTKFKTFQCYQISDRQQSRQKQEPHFSHDALQEYGNHNQKNFKTPFASATMQFGYKRVLKFLILRLNVLATADIKKDLTTGKKTHLEIKHSLQF